RLNRPGHEAIVTKYPTLSAITKACSGSWVDSTMVRPPSGRGYGIRQFDDDIRSVLSSEDFQLRHAVPVGSGKVVRRKDNKPQRHGFCFRCVDGLARNIQHCPPRIQLMPWID